MTSTLPLDCVISSIGTTGLFPLRWLRAKKNLHFFLKMAAVNGEIFVTDNLVASDGAGKRDVMVASSSAVASEMMVEGNAEGNAEEDVQVAVNSGGDSFSTPLKA